ncbi:HAD-IIIA family hydrolase [Candidatus Woesearchaeota archaeon]|nr:HAD-IIIA family hydrolase [Candidatus Woesearchaeota archaeon]
MAVNINHKDLKQFSSKKILSYSDAIKKIALLKKQGKKVGLCHGGFDLLHPGHMKHFEAAKKLCDVLFISITSDEFVTSRKGSGRPVFNENLRAYSAACVEFVDYVVISDFEKGIEVIKKLKPSYYIKGPDFINKTTPGITAEREAIKSVGGEMKYTDDPTFSTTEIIRYVKEELDRKKVLFVLDRDGTLIVNTGFLGKNKEWKKEVELKKEIIDFLIHAKTKYDTTFIVVTNQTGVARKYFDCKRVEEINKYIGELLKEKGIIVSSWQYCPDADSAYAKLKKGQIDFDYNYVKDKTKRKPHPDMVFDALKELKMDLNEFEKIIVVGDAEDDELLAGNLKPANASVKFIDSNNPTYSKLVKELEN